MRGAGGTIAWYLPDRLGTIRDLINNSGSIIDHVDYSAFGTQLDESDPSEGDRMMGFAEMEADTVAGLNLAVDRVQNPGTGRWTSQDPLGFKAGDENLYRYVGGAPTLGGDPLGTQESGPSYPSWWPFPVPPLFPPETPIQILKYRLEHPSNRVGFCPFSWPEAKPKQKVPWKWEFEFPGGGGEFGPEHPWRPTDLQGTIWFQF